MYLSGYAQPNHRLNLEQHRQLETPQHPNSTPIYIGSDTHFGYIKHRLL
jgi:hypothetical protein